MQIPGKQTDRQSFGFVFYNFKDREVSALQCTKSGVTQIAAKIFFCMNINCASLFEEAAQFLCILL